MKTAMNNTRNEHTRVWKRLLALTALAAALLTLLALPASAKSANGFRYFIDGPYSDDGECGVIITGYNATVNSTLTIPAKLAGYEVWSVGEGAFAGRTDITKLVVSDGVGCIREHAFEDCTNLRTLVVGGTYIYSDAFSGCSALKTVKITTCRGYIDPEYGWSEDGNDALFAADLQWTQYKKDYFDVECEVKTRTGKTLTLTTEYGALQNGESFRWYGINIYPCGDTEWEDCTGDTVRCATSWSEEQTVVCEVLNSKGQVVWSQRFNIEARESLKDKAESFVRGTYLYGVTEYTTSHIRWKVEDLLYKMGIDVYG